MLNINSMQQRKIIVLCLVSAFANAFICFILNDLLKIPLYADTIFTAAMCFTVGMFAGIITGVVLSPILFFIIYLYILNLSFEVALVRDTFIICIVIEVLLVCFIHSKFKARENVFLEKLAAKQTAFSSFIPIASYLLILVALDCVIISICGGIVEIIIKQFTSNWKISPEDTFKLVLIRYDVPLLFSAILSRIPINIVDRFIVVFGGYGISLLFRKWVWGHQRRMMPNPVQIQNEIL